MKTKCFILITLLFGLSFLCQAQTSNNKKETQKERVERIRKEKASKDSLNVSLNTETKKPVKKTAKSKVSKEEKDSSDVSLNKKPVKKTPTKKTPSKSNPALEKAKDDSIKNYYESQIQQERQKNEANVERLQKELNAKALLEQQLAEKEDLINQTKAEANANKAEADSSLKQLLATKQILILKEKGEEVKKEAKNVKIEAPVIADNTAIKQKNSVPINNSKKIGTIKVSIPQKGNIDVNEEKKIIRVRKSDLADKKDEIKKLESLGYTLDPMDR
ncbi:MAG: hypothetical protein WC264_03715 [Candidatus Paceibacterota bacterium]|jgi:hypothetical protein